MLLLAIICKSIGAFTIVIYSALIAFLIAYRRQFNTSFYKIFISLGVADILQRIVTELFIFFPIDGVFLTFFESNLTGFVPVFGLFVNHYFVISEAFGHMAMAVNRFTAMKYPWRYEKMWNRRWVSIAIVGQWVLALALNAFLCFAPSGFVSVGQNSLTVVIFSLPYTQAKYAVTFLVIFGVAATTFVMNLFALFSYFRQRALSHQMTQNQRKSLGSDMRLFIFSIAIFFVYCLLAVYELNSLIAYIQPSDALPIGINYYRAVNELVCDVNPYLLLLTSSAIRNQFFNLLFGSCNRSVVEQKPTRIALALNTNGQFVSTMNGRREKVNQIE